MTPQELKNSILQRAIEGKLVDQRPEEGTGAELFEKIQKEKKKLVEEGKIKKQKSLEEIKEDEIQFDIPENWKWVRLGEVANITAGGTPSRTNPQYWDGDIPWVKIADMNNKYISKTTEKISKKGLDNSSAKIFSKGTLLYSIFASIGTVGILKIDASTNQAITGINFYGLIDIDYMYYVMLGLKSILLSKARGMAQLNINQTILKNTIIPMPPLAEQKRIVDKIEELMPLVDKYEKNWQKLEELNKKFPEDMKKSLLQEAIKGKLVEQRPEERTGEELYKQIQEEKNKLVEERKIKKQKPLEEIKEDEIPFDIPENWKWVRLGDIVELNPRNQLNDDLKVGFVPMALVEDGYKNKHTYEIKKWGDIKKGYTHFADGDIGIAKITPCFQNRKSVILNNLPNGHGAGTTELSIIRIYSNYLYSKYIFNLFKSHYFINGGVKSFSGTAGQQRIDKDYLRLLYIPLPPLAEQKRIVEKLDEMLPYCDELLKII